MGIVSFEKIKLLQPGDVTSISGAGSTPRGPITPADARTTVYDPTWGYFTFDQQIATTYNEAETYFDAATFTITGIFTVNAEAGVADPQISEHDAFQMLVAKMEALQALFHAAADGVAPTDYTLFGTSSDPRCIPLPQPLVDKNGNVVYGLPSSIEIQQTRFPVEIKYKATLTEAKFPLVKLTINGLLIDNGIVVISPPKPILHRHPLVGCYGEVLQMSNFTSTEFEVSGLVPVRNNEDGTPIPDQLKNLIASMENGKMDLGVVNLLSTTSENEISSSKWPNLDVEKAGADTQFSEHAASISVRARV